MRAHRPKYDQLPDIEKKKSCIRSYLKVLIKRGKITVPKDHCLICYSKENIEFHHPEIIDRPFFVVPLCRVCHKSVHSDKFRSIADLLDL
jgi:7,8-dihydro-6-hydroxymethylpterin-pyrophosphokinase